MHTHYHSIHILERLKSHVGVVARTYTKHTHANRHTHKFTYYTQFKFLSNRYELINYIEYPNFFPNNIWAERGEYFLYTGYFHFEEGDAAASPNGRKKSLLLRYTLAGRVGVRTWWWFMCEWASWALHACARACIVRWQYIDLFAFFFFFLQNVSQSLLYVFYSSAQCDGRIYAILIHIS